MGVDAFRDGSFCEGSHGRCLPFPCSAAGDGNVRWGHESVGDAAEGRRTPSEWQSIDIELHDLRLLAETVSWRWSSYPLSLNRCLRPSPSSHTHSTNSILLSTMVYSSLGTIEDLYPN